MRLPIVAALTFAALTQVSSLRAQEPKTNLVRQAFRDTDGNRIPDRLGEAVTLIGVFTLDPITSFRRGRWAALQDESGAVLLFARDISLLPRSLKRGDQVKVAGEVGFLNGMPRFIVKQTQRLGAGVLPEARDVLVSDLLAGQYPGRLVRVVGKLVVPPDFLARRGSVSLRDRSGTISVVISDRFFDKPDFLNRFRQGGGVELVGIASQFKEAPPYDSGYQIIPRDPNDFKFAPLPPYRAFAWIAALLVVGLTTGYLFICRRVAERRLKEATERALRDSLRADVGVVLTQNQDLRTLLQKCSEILVQYLDVAFFRIWTLNDAEQVLELQASAGLYTHIDGPHRRVPVGRFKIGLVAQERQPHLTNDVSNDPRISDPEWAKREGMVAFAGYPLMVSERCVGVMATFSKRPSKDGILKEVQSVATAIAQCIERKRTEEALTQSEQFTRNIVESSLDMIITSDLERRITRINKAAQEVFGYREKEILGQPVQLLYAAGEQSEMVCQALGEHGQYVGEILNRRRNGKVFPCFLTASVLRDSHGRIVGQMGISRDISERKQAEGRAVVFSALGQRLSAATNAKAAAQIIVEAADQFFVWDACSVDSYSPGENAIRALLVMDTINGQRVEVPPAYSDTEPTELTCAIIENGGKLILRQPPLAFSTDLAAFGDVARPSASLMFVPIRQGIKVTGVISFQSYAVDAYQPEHLHALQALADYCGGALERLEAEARMRQSQALYHSLIQTLPHNVFRKDKDGRLVFANERFCLSLGRTREELLGKTDFEFFPAELAAKYQQDDRRVMETGRVWETVEQNRTPDGRTLYVQVTKAPVLDENGNIAGVQGIFWDITERKQAENILRQSEERFSKIFRANPAPMSMNTVAEGRLLEVNDHYCKFFGYSRDELIGQTVAGLNLWADQQARVRATQQLLEKGSVRNIEAKYRTRSGQVRDVLTSMELIELSGQTEPILIAMFVDVTEKKKWEAQLLRSQRVESIGTLASGVAHDLNNILAPILMAVQLLRLKPSAQEYERLVSILDGNGQRAAGIIKQLLTFARGIEGERVAIRPRDIVKEVVHIAQETFPKNITINYNISFDIGPILGDATQLHQVLLNLCLNARDAMPDGGTLSLTVENRELDETYASMVPGAQAGSYVVIQVADTGSGIPQEIRDRIFDPFFTTKPVGKGTGLGLSTTLGILKSHGGFVQVESERGKGALFKVFLPATSVDGRAVEKAKHPDLLCGRGETILVVDDEASIREMTRTVLNNYGYDTLVAEDGVEAITVFTRHAERIKLVLTDLNMPVMDGVALVRNLRRVKPDVKVIASSGMGQGSGFDKCAPELRAMGVEVFLTKPYRGEKLLNALVETLRPREAHQGPSQSDS